MFSEKKSNILFSRPSEELKASRSLWELKVKGVQGSRKTEGGIVFIQVCEHGESEGLRAPTFSW